MRFDFFHTLPIGEVSVFAEYYEAQTDGEPFPESAEIHYVEFLDGREYEPTREEREELEAAAIGWANRAPWRWASPAIWSRRCCCRVASGVQGCRPRCGPPATHVH